MQDKYRLHSAVYVHSRHINSTTSTRYHAQLCSSQSTVKPAYDRPACGLVVAGLYREVAAVFSAGLVLFGHREAGCFRQVAALHSDHYRQVPLVGAGCCRQVAALHSDHYRQVPLVGLAALDRWLPYTVTTIDRSH